MAASASASAAAPYGYGSYGYDPYYSSGYGSAYGYNPYGWYNGYYYPGSGYWVYDPDRNRRELTPAERAYWRERIRRHYEELRNKGTTTTTAVKENWTGFRRPTATTGTTGATGTEQHIQSRALVRQRVLEQQQARTERQQAARVERQQARAERQQVQRQEIQERREARRASSKPDE